MFCTVWVICATGRKARRLNRYPHRAVSATSRGSSTKARRSVARKSRSAAVRDTTPRITSVP